MGNTIPVIKETRHWSMEDLREFCIRHNLFTKGDNEEYSRMLKNAQYEPSNEMIWYVADQINFCSEEQTVENLMYLLRKEVVVSTFELEDVWI